MSPTEPDYVEELRLIELHEATDWLEHGRAILEIGAGTGWQARELSRMGHSVEAVDLPASVYSRQRVWNIRDYDGRHLPFEDEAFDVVFSSNVLEHVPHLVELLREAARVTRPGGYLIHILPSASWRLWTLLAYYPHLLGRAWQRWRASVSSAPSSEDTSLAMEMAARPVSWHRFLLAPAHGEHATALGELLAFRQTDWYHILSQPEVEVLRRQSTRLFYSGYGLLGGRLSASSRNRLSRLLGSSCHIFILRKKTIAH